MAFRTAFALALAFCIASCATAPTASNPALDELARDASRAESVREVKTLQRSWAQYAQYGLWNQVGGLFTADASFTFDGQVTPGEVVNGPAAIAGFLRKRYGSGDEGLLPGATHTMMIEAPLVSLSVDGESAKGRWYALIFTGSPDGRAALEGGTFVNDYVRQGGVWKIAAAHYYPQFQGPYDTGWTNWGGGQLPVVPYHYTADTAGIPIPPPAGPAPASGATLGELQQRIAALNAEDQVRNLQAAYGYYLDRKMWSDVADLFAEDSAVEVAGQGVWRGPAGVRNWLATMGPEGLRHGQFNDWPQFDVLVEIAPGGNEAWVRGIELGMLGEADEEKGWWEVASFRNRFVREGGVWKIKELRRFPVFKSDYYVGWGKSRLVDRQDMPAFLAPNPVTGKPIMAEGKAGLVATTALTGAVTKGKPAPIGIDEARRRLALSTAYDGVENVSSAYTYYLDDYQSHQFGALLADDGFKMSAFAGYYVGRDRVTEAGVRVWGNPPTLRDGIHFHWRPQPVIMVAPDGRSANLRVRLFQPRTGKTVGGPGAWYAANFMTGMYHDQFVLERGVWRFWNLSLDEPYVGTVDWKQGWAKAKDPTQPPSGPASALLAGADPFLPDVPVTALGKRQEHFRGGTGDPLQWPSILPMWFEYTNPVSGRLPEHYQEDCPPCLVRKDLRLDHHGFLQPEDLKELNRKP